ncbi:MAG: hypothetical protein MUO82_07775 [Candidatus Thermoplasmatota archaeon]|nr:hypothetical protein [Candidatus Thermoplasmatota archaeon]
MEKEKVDIKLKDGHLNPKLFNGIFTKNFLNFLNTINKKEDVTNIIDKMNNWMIENTLDERKELDDALQDVVYLYAMALVDSFQAYQKYNDVMNFSEYTKQ